MNKNKTSKGTKEPDREALTIWKLKTKCKLLETENKELLKGITSTFDTRIYEWKTKVRKLTETLDSQQEKEKLDQSKYEHLLVMYENSEALYEQSRKECAALKDMLSESKRKSKNKVKSLTDMHENYVTNIKNKCSQKLQQRNEEMEILKADHKKHLNELALKQQQSKESMNKEITEKNNKITELMETIEQLQQRIQNIYTEKNKEIDMTRKESQWERESKICTLENELKAANSKSEALQQEVSNISVEHEDLQKKYQGLCIELSSNEKELYTLNEEKKQIQIDLLEEQTKSAMLEAQFCTTEDDTNEFLRQIKKLEDIEHKNKRELRLAKYDIEDLRDMTDTQAFQLGIYEPSLKKMKGDIKASELWKRDILVALEGCRGVLDEPKQLKTKVCGLIGHFLDDNKKIKVDEPIEKAHMQKLAMLEKKLDLTQKTLQHEQNEKKWMKISMARAETMLMDENTMFARHINEALLKDKKRQVVRKVKH